MNLNYRLILASKSPRRQAILTDLGLPFEVIQTSVDESYPADIPLAKVAEFLAHKKATAHPIEDGTLLITADTVVINDDAILGKPENEAQAINILTSLSGKTHLVVTGVCLRSNQKTTSFSATTEVTFNNLTEAEIEHYVNIYQPLDKAGAYGIQEWIGMIGISSIKGDYYNVVGMPAQALWSNLKTFA